MEFVVKKDAKKDILPKDCRYWTIVGCNRKNDCDYLHSDSKKFSDIDSSELKSPSQPFANSDYNCNKCDFKTADRDSFNHHIVSCVYEKSIIYGKNDTDIVTVNEDISEEKQIKCNVCSKLFKGKKGLKMHMARSICRQSIETLNEQNTIPSNSNVKYACDNCDYESDQQHELNNHISLMHKLLSCDVCKYSCQDLTTLNVHMFNVHKSTDNNTTDETIVDSIAEIEGNFSCNQCNYKTQNTYDYMSHASYAHVIEETLLCDKCNFQTKTDNEFVSHLTHQHNKTIIAPWD